MLYTRTIEVDSQNHRVIFRHGLPLYKELLELMPATLPDAWVVAVAVISVTISISVTITVAIRALMVCHAVKHDTHVVGLLLLILLLDIGQVATVEVTLTDGIYREVNKAIDDHGICHSECRNAIYKYVVVAAA